MKTEAQIVNRKQERRVGDERVEAVARQLNENTGRLQDIERSLEAIRQANLETQKSVQAMAASMEKLAVLESRLANEYDHREAMKQELGQLRKEFQDYKDQATAEALTAAKLKADEAAETASDRARGKWLERSFWTVFTALVIGTFGYFFEVVGAG